MPKKQSSPMTVQELKTLHNDMSSEIECRLGQFERLWEEGDEEDLLAELVFCLFTPQSKARSCWGAVECLIDRELLLSGAAGDIANELRVRGVRFHRHKASYAVEARSHFIVDGDVQVRAVLWLSKEPDIMREWLVTNVRGLGYKEASHFLRNIGLGRDLAILDRHILKNLAALGVIDQVPRTLTKRRYLEIEGAMRCFSKRVGIPMDNLDLLLWFREAGEVFK